MQHFIITMIIFGMLFSCSSRRNNNSLELPTSDRRSKNINNPIMRINGIDYETNVEAFIFDIEKLDLQIVFDSNLSNKSAKYNSNGRSLKAYEVSERFKNDTLYLTFVLDHAISSSQDPTQKFVIHTVSKKGNEIIENDFIVSMTKYKRNKPKLVGVDPPVVFVNNQKAYSDTMTFDADSIDIRIEFDRVPIRRITSSSGTIDVKGGESSFVFDRKEQEDRKTLSIEWGFKGNSKKTTYTFILKNPFPFGKFSLSNINVNCSAMESCPENIGVLLTKSERGLASCTAFLLEPSTIATNGHCLESVKACKDDCAKLTQVKFGKFYYNCTKIGDIIQNGALDYAFCTLDKPVKLTSYKEKFVDRPLSSNEIYTWNMDPPKSDNLIYEHKKRTCALLSGHHPYYTQGIDDALLTTSCDIISGNSGSPLFSKDGNVLGILFANIDSRRGFTWNASKGTNSIATNRKCICLPGETCALEDFCYKGLLDTQKRKAAELESKISKADLKKFIEKVSSLRPIDLSQQLFILDSTASLDTIKVGFKPNCIQRNEFTNTMQIALCDATLHMNAKLEVTRVELFETYCAEYTLNQNLRIDPKFHNYTMASVPSRWLTSAGAFGIHEWEFCIP